MGLNAVGSGNMWADIFDYPWLYTCPEETYALIEE